MKNRIYRRSVKQSLKSLLASAILSLLALALFNLAAIDVVAQEPLAQNVRVTITVSDQGSDRLRIIACKTAYC